MCILECFVFDLQELLIGTSHYDETIIRRHSRRLEEVGDISFPVHGKNWYHLIDRKKFPKESLDNIFDYKLPQVELKTQIEDLKEKSKTWQINIERVHINENNAHLFLKRCPYLLKTVITEVLNKKRKYGSSKTIQKKFNLCCDDSFKDIKLCETDLSTLRLLILRDVSLNLLNFTINSECEEGGSIIFTLNSANLHRAVILCGPVLSEKGIKDSKTTAEELFDKRASDMRMMAQHKYGIQVKPNTSWKSYFEKIGKAAVTIEMLSNKPSKALKLTIHDLQTANKEQMIWCCSLVSGTLLEIIKITDFLLELKRSSNKIRAGNITLFVNGMLNTIKMSCLQKTQNMILYAIVTDVVDGYYILQTEEGEYKLPVGATNVENGTLIHIDSNKYLRLVMSYSEDENINTTNKESLSMINTQIAERNEEKCSGVFIHSVVHIFKCII